MNLLDLLFWLLITMLGGVAWAIEAGLTTRHRRLLLTSTISTFGAVLFIMFWIDDESAFKLAPRPTAIHTKGAPEERGTFKFDHGKKKKKSENPQDSGEDETDDGDGAEEADADAATAAKAPEYVREPFRDCPNCPEMVIVNVKQDGQSPVPKSYAIGRLEVLRREFSNFVQSTSYVANQSCDIQSTRRGRFSWRMPGIEQDSRHPVVCVSTTDVEAFVTWLSARTGRTYRLPSEEEWTFAARGGKDSPYWQGTSVWPTQANFGRSRDGTIPGGSTPANPFGLSDVSGNVWELVASCAAEGALVAPMPKESKDKAQSAGPADSCERRMVKGGAWDSPVDKLRLDTSAALPAGVATNTVGFRVMRELDDRDNDKILSSAKKKAIAADDRAAAEIDEKERAAAEKAEQDRIEAEAKAESEALPKADKK